MADENRTSQVSEELARLQADLDEANSKAEEYKNLLQRVQADFVNYRRRVEQEKQEFSQYAKGDLLLKLLPVLDDFELALGSIPPEEKERDWVQGILLIERKLGATLESEGLSKIEAEGQTFDPREHEALLYQDSTNQEEGRVSAVLRQGYKLNGRVLRPAQVAVSRGLKNVQESDHQQ